MTTMTTETAGRYASLRDLAHYMDEEAREDLHFELAGHECTAQEFWDAYVDRYQESAEHVLSIVQITDDPDRVNGDVVRVA